MPITQADMANRTDFLPGSIQRSPTLGGQHYSVRTVANGTIANTEATMSTVITDGIINIENALVISIWYVYVEGSLTTMQFWPQFNSSNHTVDTWLEMLDIGANVAGAITILEKIKFNFPASPGGNQSGVFSFANPGASRMRFRILSTGTITSSSLLLNVSFGFGIPILQSTTAVV